jgi:hypothetical protein
VTAPTAPPATALDARRVAAALENALDGQLRRYRVGGASLPEGLRLYRWNAAVSAAMFEVLGTVEITVRTAVAHELAALVPGGRWWERAWWLDADPARRGDLDRALARPGGRDREQAVLARLPFGFWADLLAPGKEAELWRPALRHAFPGLPAGRGRGDLHAALVRLAGLRNRIAHHEPVHHEPLAALHDDAVAAVAAVCPVTAGWAARTSRVPVLLLQDPRR